MTGPQEGTVSVLPLGVGGSREGTSSAVSPRLEAGLSFVPPPLPPVMAAAPVPSRAGPTTGIVDTFAPPPRPTAPAQRQPSLVTPTRTHAQVPMVSGRRSRAGAPAVNRQQGATSQPGTSAALPPLPRPQVAARSTPTRRPKVLPYVPKNLWALFQDVCRPIFADLERASACSNMVEIERLLKELLEVPAHTLSVRRGGRRLESGIASQLRAATITRAQPPLQARVNVLRLNWKSSRRRPVAR